MTRPKITNVRPVDEGNQVVSVEGGRGLYRRSPCGGCPWRVDQTGSFPAEAFGHSAPVSYDMSSRTFGCHESGAETPMVCAGFLRAHHNMAVRIRMSSGQIDLNAVHDGGHELHEDYRTMAIANGMDPADPRLRGCR